MPLHVRMIPWIKFQPKHKYVLQFQKVSQDYPFWENPPYESQAWEEEKEKEKKERLKRISQHANHKRGWKLRQKYASSHKWQPVTNIVTSWRATKELKREGGGWERAEYYPSLYLWNIYIKRVWQLCYQAETKQVLRIITTFFMFYLFWGPSFLTTPLPSSLW